MRPLTAMAIRDREALLGLRAEQGDCPSRRDTEARESAPQSPLHSAGTAALGPLLVRCRRIAPLERGQGRLVSLYAACFTP